MVGFLLFCSQLSGMYYEIMVTTHDQILADFMIAFYVTWSMIYQSLIRRDITEANVSYYGQFLLSYYLVDTILYFIVKRPDRMIYVSHHTVSLILIALHLSGSLPLTIGIRFLLLFEYSNAFVSLFHLCNQPN